MYAIYGNIYHQYTPVMLAYIPYVDPMGWEFHGSFWLRLKYVIDERWGPQTLGHPELQRTPETHPVTTPRFNLAFVKLGNFDEITTY